MFAEQGPDAPLESVAAAAGVSHTTAYRNFATREQFAATVFEDNVAQIEALAGQTAGRPDGLLVLLDVVVDMMRRDRSLVPVLIKGSDVARSRPSRTGPVRRSSRFW